MSVKRQIFKVQGMHCSSCEILIESDVRQVEGVINAKASYRNSSVSVEYNSEICTCTLIEEAIIKSGYEIASPHSKNLDFKNIIGILAIAAIIIILGKYSGSFNMESKLQQGSALIVLFIVGLFTSLHCVGMCGGIMLSQSISSIKKNKLVPLTPALLYNLGRVISYTILGGVVGAIGSIFSISLYAKSAITIFAGLFMIIMGFNLAGFKIFRKLHIKLPWSICSSNKKTKAPFIVGILNGFMPCGPLQTMQLYALGTGSAIKGALSMFAFSLGTVPLMLSFGIAVTMLNKSYSRKILKLSGVLVIILGFIMINRGALLSGVNFSSKLGFLSNRSENIQINYTKAEIKDGYQILKMTADYSGYLPNVLYVQKGIPVKWVIDGKGLTTCNNEIIVPSYDIQKKLSEGENIIEFTPGNNDINFSCWMGMIDGIIKVTDDLDNIDNSVPIDEKSPSRKGSGCCSTN
ncbi:urease accessory protein UreH domain-containing protein [Oceanirhabdus sp. W0125-5]|uniref:urease accessory protein UreH domain-containing protein n=1 Tax=Oceanirhabdus sp. W0125-5 TaxID=2999116 RepID=UPI0022F2D915|nr:sulfite exporter TauE/SafE family protein [Oceanirhabdus sp. W0125-5]WBW95008.1 sulfite exporter TauE/SafE family protein [Oceanirhabdus sp. W0125-5]